MPDLLVILNTPWTYPGSIYQLSLLPQWLIRGCLLHLEELIEFTNFTANFHPALIFTWTISDIFPLILSLTISTLEDRLSSANFEKPTPTGILMPPSPTQSLANVPFFTLNFTSIASTYKMGLPMLRHSWCSLSWVNVVFHPAVVDESLTYVSSVSCSSALAPSSPKIDWLPSSSPFTPQPPHYSPHLHYLQRNPVDSHIFPFSIGTISHQNHSLPGAFPDNHRRSNTCP